MPVLELHTCQHCQQDTPNVGNMHRVADPRVWLAAGVWHAKRHARCSSAIIEARKTHHTIFLRTC